MIKEFIRYMVYIYCKMCEYLQFAVFHMRNALPQLAKFYMVYELFHCVPFALSSCGIVHMIMSSNGNIFRVTDPLFGEFTGHRWIPSQRPVTRSFAIFFDLHLNERLSKQP